MMFDGEWRVAMIEDYAPDLNYGTAPYPTPDGQEDQYGIGRVGGTIVGHPARLRASRGGVAPGAVPGHRTRTRSSR